MSTKLISFYQNHPPDLQKREYLRDLGLKYSDAEVGEAQVGRMLSLPPAGASAIVTTNSQAEMRNWLNKGGVSTQGTDLSHDIGSSVPENSGSLVAPLLWVPGVLRSTGSWATVMKETQEGTAYGLLQGVDLIKADDEIPLSKKGPSLEQQLLDKDRLIGEMERAMVKQKHATEQVVRSAKTIQRSFSRSINDARRQEKLRHEKEIEMKLQPLRDQLRNVKEDFSTLRKAHKVRVQRAYAQDNFISQYAKALSSVKEQAREIANKEQAQLRNKVGALERRNLRDQQYKLALKARTETAENTAELKYRDAESKIPKLEEQLLHCTIEMEQAKRCDFTSLYRPLLRERFTFPLSLLFFVPAYAISVDACLTRLILA
jgi:hypothetical protein